MHSNGSSKGKLPPVPALPPPPTAALMQGSLSAPVRAPMAVRALQRPEASWHSHLDVRENPPSRMGRRQQRVRNPVTRALFSVPSTASWICDLARGAMMQIFCFAQAITMLGQARRDLRALPAPPRKTSDKGQLPSYRLRKSIQGALEVLAAGVKQAGGDADTAWRHDLPRKNAGTTRHLKDAAEKERQGSQQADARPLVRGENKNGIEERQPVDRRPVTQRPMDGESTELRGLAGCQPSSPIDQVHAFLSRNTDPVIREAYGTLRQVLRENPLNPAKTSAGMSRSELVVLQAALRGNGDSLL